ncbi:pyridoxamine 5'-phosphate oxidase family protein [Haloarchaeobius amylolyticus]|uniref:Pyridoxamine 5'-phosphate oxidase family protein n=1 Tax=Haloarchaeobius amylolyticus TaxID=1198296 RepID=A0ABD6BKI9_9EURY
MTIDELSDYGMDRMTDDEIRGFLSNQNVGVLGLPTENVPVMRPLFFWYDGEARVYFLYVLGSESQKEDLSDRADAAQFLVYNVDTPFMWTSVLLTGPISDIPESERESVEDAMDMQWRPDLFERAGASENTKLYQLQIEDQVGLTHRGLPPAFETDSSENRSE